MCTHWPILVKLILEDFKSSIQDGFADCRKPVRLDGENPARLAG